LSFGCGRRDQFRTGASISEHYPVVKGILQKMQKWSYKQQRKLAVSSKLTILLQNTHVWAHRLQRR